MKCQQNKNKPMAYSINIDLANYKMCFLTSDSSLFKCHEVREIIFTQPGNFENTQ